MKNIFILIILMALSVSLHADDFVIDDYEFTWNVESVGNAEFSIEKSNDSLKVIISITGGIGFDFLYLTPKEAKSIGETLKLTEKYYKKQKDTIEDVSDKVNSDNYVVLFSTSVKYGFDVYIRENSLFGDGIHLDRKQARKLSKLLLKAEDMANFLNKQVDY